MTHASRQSRPFATVVYHAVCEEKAGLQGSPDYVSDDVLQGDILLRGRWLKTLRQR